jgi:hypothetical protein
MPMLDANDDAFWQHFTDGAVVFDARGRQLHNVVACDPLTGEVVMVDLRPAPWWQHLAYRTGIPRRHGFWPAPLTVVDRRTAAADALRTALP